MDKYLPWEDRAPAQPCICANTTAGSATGPGTSGCDNGQACYWYQQGCSIGCPTCDSVSGRVQIDICGLGKVGIKIINIFDLISSKYFLSYLIPPNPGGYNQ